MGSKMKMKSHLLIRYKKFTRKGSGVRHFSSGFESQRSCDMEVSVKNFELSNGYPFVKSAYYTGKLLHASDLVREQKYGSGKLEFVIRNFLGWGILEGLEVKLGKEGNLSLSAGSAIDPCGRIIVVPEDCLIKPDDIEGFRQEARQDVILGIRYVEKVVETETDTLEKEKKYRPAVIAESFALKLYGESEFRKLKRAVMGQDNIFTEEKVLYQNEAVTLTVRIPKVVPSDSLFKIRMQARITGGSNVCIGWRGMAKLQGAFFAQSGEAFCILEEEPTMCSGSLQREWEIYTEESRNLTVLLEISRLKIITEDAETTEISTCQFSVETAVEYRQAAKKYLRAWREQEWKEPWVPLARLVPEESMKPDSQSGKYGFILQKISDECFFAVRPWEEEILKRIGEENGILDIKWRTLLKHMWRLPLSPPLPPESFAPSPAIPTGQPHPPGSQIFPDQPHPSGSPIFPDQPHPPGSQIFPGQPYPPERFWEGLLTEQRFWELVDADRESRFSRGIAVIPIPKRYRKGQVLYSEEISHGFPGEEVFLWCNRVWEEISYAYWERDRKRYKIIQGDEDLFPDACDGQEILRQAVLQNVEEGTFQIALTLNRPKARKRSKEVAVSWIAVRTV